MLDFIDIEQNTDEWFELRGGRLTSSKLPVIMANFGKSFGDPAKKYAVNIAVEQITGNPITSSYSNAHMERGHEQEPLARMLYEEENFCEVTNGGFFCNEFIGCSPDGLVGDDGAIEIKSVIPAIHFANVKRQSFDPAYKWQFIGNLLFTGKDWLDFASYCQEFPVGRQLYIHRLRKSKFSNEFAAIKSRVAEFKELVDYSRQKILSMNYSS